MRACRHAAFALLALACGAAAGGDAPSVTLAADAHWRFAAPPPPTPRALDRAWGQFELLLPREGFPVPAPRCRAAIRLRWIGLSPDTAGRDERLAGRWLLLQQLRALQERQPGADPVTVPLNLRHYTQRDRKGELVLSGCNAFADQP